MTFEEFKKEWEEKVLPNKNSQIRKGQALINFLAKSWFPEYKRLVSTLYVDKEDIDCFYVDSLIPNTLKHLESVWDKYPD